MAQWRRSEDRYARCLAGFSFRFWGLGLGFWIYGSGVVFRVTNVGTRFRVQGNVLKVLGLAVRFRDP